MKKRRMIRNLTLLSLCVHVVLYMAFSLVWSDEVCQAASSDYHFQQIKADRPNVVTFDPVQAKFLRFVIYSSKDGTPAVDELLVFDSDVSDASNLARNNVKGVFASSCISGYAIHRIENVNDGFFGNEASWVANDLPSRDNPQWIAIEWNEQTSFDRVVFSRDRSGKYSDRLPLDFEIQVSTNGVDWQSVAFVHGITDEISRNGLSEYGSSWFSDVPSGDAWNWEPPRAGNEKQSLTPYERQLQDAFLAEENAILKIAGFADCERWLIQRHYPEYVEPEHKPDSVLPLPCVHAGEVRETETTNWSSGTVWAFVPGSFDAGPLLEQTVSAIADDAFLHLRITGNRFLSENIALISTENLPLRGFIVYRSGRVLWRQLDSFDDRDSGWEKELSGSFNEKDGEFLATIPLEFFPEWKERGLYVTLGIGGRHVLPGGRPVHFRPAEFSAAISRFADSSAHFNLRLRSFSEKVIELSSSLGDVKLAPGETKEISLQGVYGQAGAELVWNAFDKENDQFFCAVAFRYDPCYRPLCQLKDSLERAESDAEERLDERDFRKRFAVPGVVNPRYVETDEYQETLADEYDSLCRYFSERPDNDENTNSVGAKAKKLWEAWLLLRENSALPNSLFKAQERKLLWEVRLLKRDHFLSNPDLEPVEHILANKRNPFWPSHNYSDLFDSTWNPGGAVVLIDMPRENGRLAPEKATTRELVNAGSGVIRNPSASFDAKRIYYAYRASLNDYFRIYELSLETGDKRLVSAPGPFHDFWPIELPDGGLAFISTRCKKKFICWRPQAFVLYRMNKDGGDITPLSYANLSEFAPSVNEDGVILWTRSEYVDKGADYGHTLWTIRTDGTSPELVFGNTINLPQGYANGRLVPDSREVLCVMISHFGDLNGPVALLDTSLGPHDPAAIRSITPEVPWPGYWARTETFREPVPVSRDVFLVAHAAQDRFGLYLIDRFGNRELLTLDDSIDTICPQLFGEREVPPVVDNPPDEALAEKGFGRFSIVNVYRGLEGQVEPGAARYLRVCQEMPTPLKQLDDGTYQFDHEPFMEYYASPVDVLQGRFGWPSYVAKGVLGTVEIEKDGSADFYAPAGKVLFFELLDENFNEIQRMRSVVQLRPGEQRSCVGCHESRLSVPEGGLTQASIRGPQTLKEPPWGAGPFWYERVVQPALDRNCLQCHTAETARENPRQLDLSSERDENKIPASYRSLIQSGDVHYFDYTWGAGKTTKAQPYTFGTSQSRIWKILEDENHRDVSLSPEEEQAIKCWTDLNVPLWGDYQIRRERD